MAKIHEILKDKGFQELSYEDKRGVLSHFDNNFQVLEPEAQDEVMRHFNLNQPEIPAEDRNPVAKAASDIYTPALVTLGGVAGGAAGMAAGPGAPAAVPVGGALGMAAGEAASEGIDRLTGLKPPIQGIVDAVSEIAKNIEHGVEYEIGGRVAGKAIVFASGPMASRLNDGMKMVMRKAKDMGIELSPAEVLGSKTLSLLENVMDNLPIVSDFSKKFRLDQVKQMIKQRDYLLKTHGSADAIESLGESIQQAADDTMRAHTKLSAKNSLELKNRLLRKLGSSQTYEEVGMTGQEALKMSSQKRYDEAQKLYESVGEYFPESAKHVPQTYREKAFELLSQQEKASPSLQDTEALAVLRDISGKNKIEELLKKIPVDRRDDFLEQLPVDSISEMTWQQMAADRTRLGKLIAENDPSYGFAGGAKGSKLVSNEAAGVYKQLFKALDEDMGMVAAEAGPEAEQALGLARSYYGESKQIFNTPHVLRMAKADPEKLVDMVFKPGAITPIKMARKAIGNEAFDGLTRKFTDKLLQTSESVPLTSDLIDARIRKYGIDTIEEIYGPRAKEIIDLPRQLETLEAPLKDNQFFQSLLKRSPEKVIDFLVKPENTKNAKMLAEGLGVKMKEKAGQGLVTKILEDAAVNSHGDLSPAMLDSALNKYGDDTLKSWIPEDVLEDLKDFAQVTMQMKKAAAMGNNPSGTARVLGTGALGAYVIYNPKKAAKVAIPAALVAQMYFTPTGRKYLTEGFKTSLKSPQAQYLFNRISSSALEMLGQELKED